MSSKQGPLAGIRVVEIASIGPGPFTAMMLADAGADVIRLERAGADVGLGAGAWNATNRGRPSVVCDLKHPDGRELALRLGESADALTEGFRPGMILGLLHTASMRGVRPDVSQGPDGTGPEGLSAPERRAPHGQGRHLRALTGPTDGRSGAARAS